MISENETDFLFSDDPVTPMYRVPRVIRIKNILFMHRHKSNLCRHFLLKHVAVFGLIERK
jgi:hypothetical protein